LRPAIIRHSKKNKKNLRNQKVSYTFVTDQLHKKQFYL